MESIHHEVSLANTAAEIARLNRQANFVSIESYLAWLPDEDVLRIFREIGGLRNLRTFRISFSFQRFRQIPVLPIPSQALVTLLESAQQLGTLTLDECRFVFRDDNDLQALSVALQRASNLKHMTLFNCFPQQPTNTFAAEQQPQNLSTHSLAQGLAEMPALEELNLIFTLEGPELWISSLLRESCSSQSIKSLKVNVPDGCCTGDPLQSMCRALETNSVLKELSIRCPLDDEGGIALGRALKSPRNVLEEVYIQMKSYHFAVPIAHALRDSQHLKSLELRVWTGGDRMPLLHAFETIIPHNLTLEQLIIDNGRHGLTPLIAFYLALNRAGRRVLLEQGENLRPQILIDFLTRFSADVSGLYYTLSLHPCLICGGGNDALASMDAMQIDGEPRHKRQKLDS